MPKTALYKYNRFNKSLGFSWMLLSRFLIKTSCQILSFFILTRYQKLIRVHRLSQLESCLQDMLCSMKLTLFQRNIHLWMKSDECHCVQYNHIYQPMNGQLTMSIPRLHLIRVFHVLPKVHALFKSLLSICLFLTKSILFVQNILSKRNTNLYDCIRNDLRFFSVTFLQTP